MNIAVFGGSKCTDEVGAMAEDLGALLAQAGHTVITGGYGGVMERVSKGAFENGGATVGVVIEGVKEPNRFINDVRIVKDYWQRMVSIMDAGDAYISLPGGSGTSTELLAVLNLQGVRAFMAPGLNERKVIFLSSDESESKRVSGWLREAAGDAVAGLLLHAVEPQQAVALLDS